MTATRESTDRVAVIDIGSNSIKMLVAESAGHGRPLRVIAEATEDTRISAGISQAAPVLLEPGMRAGLEAVERLQLKARTHGPRAIALTATSAVRDALNQDEFRRRIEEQTGLQLRILSGLEEARLIALGIRCDPGLGDLDAFYLFDLGGGSLEALAIDGEHVRQLDSLPLGCVRLTEQFIADREAPFSSLEQEQVAAHVRSVLQNSRFHFDLGPEARTVITGGTATIARMLMPAVDFRPSPTVSRDDLDRLLQTIGSLPLKRRRHYPGLPPARADVFPVALATVHAVLTAGDIESFQHSFCNLRHGVASEML